MPYIACNGIRLNYDTCGEGEQIFLLLHNAGGNLHFMNCQYHHLSQKGKVLSIDLRGHGESDKPDSNYSMSLYAEDILALCSVLDIKQTTVIGLNYGGVLGIELANKNHKFVSDLILIDPPMLMESWLQQLILKHIDELQDPNINFFSQKLVDSVMIKATEEDKLMAIKAFDSTLKPALIATYKDLLEWDLSSKDKIQKCDFPVLNIQSSRPFCSEESLRNVCKQLVCGKVVNSGPWASLEVPNQVNSMIDRFLNI